jgi:uncharacterized protein (DUF433 family)
MDTTENRIVSTPDTCGGKPRIAGTRIKVQHVAIWYERMGMSPDEIASTWPHLTLADVQAALADSYGHREQIDADICKVLPVGGLRCAPPTLHSGRIEP